MRHLLKNIVLVACLVMLGAFGAWVWLRPELPRASTFKDSTGDEVSVRDVRDEVRMALWGQPDHLDDALRSGETESDPSQDAFTGRTFFTVGKPGQNQDLYVSTPGLGAVPDVRRIDSLCSQYDDAGPHYHRGFLYFSSNRPGGAGGFDLYRSRWTSQGFLPPEHLGVPVNGPADDVDPHFRPGSRELYFASNRDEMLGSADYDLYFSTTDGDRFSDASVLHLVASAYDERSPTFGGGGSMLVFSSDRPGGAGGFDLYRSLHLGVTFEAVENLGRPNSPDNELSPFMSDGGFSVLFSSDRNSGDGSHDLYIARTEELYPLPGDGVNLLDFTILFLLALIAALAYLARRWEALDILYKCILLSVILHLIFLWFSRRIDIAVESEQAPGPSEDVYEVSLVNDVLTEVKSMSDRERQDQVEAPTPREAEAEMLRQAQDLSPSELTAPSMEQMTRPEMADVVEAMRAPNSSLAPQHVNEMESVDVRTPEESYERRPSEAAANVAVEANATSAERSATAVEVSRTQTETELAATSEPMTASSGIARSEISAEAPEAAERTLAPERSAVPDRVAVETPTDRAEFQRVEAPKFSPDTVDVTSDLSGPQTAQAPTSREDATPELATVETARRRNERNLDKASPNLAAFDPLADRGRTTPVERTLTPQPTAAAETLTPEDRVDLGPAPAEAALAVAERSDLAKPQVTTAGDVARTSDSAPSNDSLDVGPTAVSAMTLAERAPESAPSRASDGGALERTTTDTGNPVAVATPDDRLEQERGPTIAPSITEAPDAQQFDRQAKSVADVDPSRVDRASGANAPSTRHTTGSTLDRVDAVAEASPRRDVEAAPTVTRSGGSPDLRAMDEIRPTLPGRTEQPRAVVSAPTTVPSPGPARLSGLLPERPTTAVGPARLEPKADAKPLAMLRPDPAVERTRPDRANSAPPRLSQLYERRQGSAKEQALREGGGGRETERAVVSGLRYLASIQRNRGNFGDRNESSDREKYRDVRVGKTGLAALAFLGAGHTPASDTEFSGNVNSALDWLVRQQDRDSGHFGDSDGYSHGIATYALAECYAMTKDRRLLTPLLRAVQHIERMQVTGMRDRTLNGGWAYYYPDGRGQDPYPRASMSSWQVMALESAKVGGLPVSDESLLLAKSFFKGSWDDRYDYFRYNHDPGWLNNPDGYRTLPATTPASMFVLNLLGLTDDAVLDGGAEYVMDRVPEGYFYRSDDAFATKGVGNLYFWYYGTLAMYMRGGPQWRTWNDAMKKTLLQSQERDGSWNHISVYARSYAGDDAGERTYTTALSVLILEVYYRYFTPQLQRARGG